MYKLVCIEGPDGAGKTTLIEKLRHDAQPDSRQYFAVIKSSGPPPDQVGAPFMKAAINFSRAFPYPVVLDRCHPISEAIYAHVIRGTSMPTIAQIQAQLVEFDLIVYCRPPRERIIQNLRQNAQMKGVPESIEMIIRLYDFVMGGLHRVYWFDYTTNPIDYVRNRIFQLQAICARCRSPKHHVQDCPE